MQSVRIMMLFDEAEPTSCLDERDFPVTRQRVQEEQSLDPLEIAYRVCGSNKSAPVLHHEGDVLQIERIYQSG